MRGKLRAGVTPRRKDWDDVMWTLFSVRDTCTEEQVLAMTPRQRKEAQRQYERECLERFTRRKAERDAAWLTWHRSTDPERPLTWKSYCEAIGRPDLYRNEVLTGLRNGALIAADEDYEGPLGRYPI
jgi:hypothetical protein